MEDRIYKTEDLDKLELQLSEDEEIMLKEIATLSQNDEYTNGTIQEDI